MNIYIYKRCRKGAGGGDIRLDNVLHQLLANGFVGNVLSMLGRDDHGVDTDLQEK